jgi:hypothetical protein
MRSVCPGLDGGPWPQGKISCFGTQFVHELIEWKGRVDLTEIFEAAMVICFGLSWPVSIIKSYRARTSKGKSILFMSFIWIGYVFGIFSKILSGTITYVFVFYILNLIMVSIDCVLYFRNAKIDKGCQK